MDDLGSARQPMSGWARFVGQLKGFAIAVGAGALAGASPFLIVTISYAIGMLFPQSGEHNELLAVLWIAFLPLLISLPCVLVCSTLVGLPLTFAAARARKESPAFYAFSGAWFGPLAVILFFMFVAKAPALDVTVLALFVPLAGVSGTITGFVWGAFRERHAKAD